MHGQITLTEWISRGDVHHMAKSWLYARSNHILEDAILIIQGMFNQLSVDQCYHSPPPHTHTLGYRAGRDTEGAVQEGGTGEPC